MEGKEGKNERKVQRETCSFIERFFKLQVKNVIVYIMHFCLYIFLTTVLSRMSFIGSVRYFLKNFNLLSLFTTLKSFFNTNGPLVLPWAMVYVHSQKSVMNKKYNSDEQHF